MVTIEQVELLESKVSTAIDYVKRLTADNERLKENSFRLVSENDILHRKLDGYQTRITELEVMLQGFKQDQERIEQGIVSALERLNHFEDAVAETVAVDNAVTADKTAGSAHGGTAAAGNGVPGGMERQESVYSAPSGDRSSPASVAPPSAASQPASAEIPAASVFPGAVPAEPIAAEKEAAWTDETGGESDADSYDSSDLLASFEPKADMSGAGASDETFDEMSGGTEIGIDDNDGFGADVESNDDNENNEDNEDEFLDALKSGRPSGLGQAAAAFHETAEPLSENTFEKPAGGLELDIF